MTLSAVAIASDESPVIAGQKLGAEILGKLDGKAPHAMLVFASARYDYQELLASIQQSCEPEILVGCSSAGEFTDGAQKEGAVCAVGIWSSHLRFSASVGRNLRNSLHTAADEIVANFQGLRQPNYRYHTAIVMTDALAGYTDDFIQALMLKTQGKYQLVGGGAGDDAKFSQTQVFLGTKAYKDAAVALEILSNEPIGIGVKHGWETASEAMRVTEAEGSCLISVNGMPAIEVFQDFAESTQQMLDREDPLSFFLHNVIGIESLNGYKLRVPLIINPDGSISCASNIPVDSTIYIMRTTVESAAEAASQATEMAMAQLNGKEPKVAIFFDCVATRLRMGIDFGMELKALSQSLKGTEFVGCNTYGQIARVDGQFSGFHNCTAVTCLLP
ncbi:MAG TPA: FIST N-terminal domain-containing protein [Oligoflexus sp.]|uniref:FIST signal transduction protein n=1 Tax=Oligoflexus sp. TaxID=1971216 RepID=UPI002D29AF7A|nr:FIST N-terminal domain-containing protein [Oligoflexus sp.]HYX33810.1 FIST N-terminal domain-containing protein [Oligoflexus sp.]